MISSAQPSHRPRTPAVASKPLALESLARAALSQRITRLWRRVWIRNNCLDMAIGCWTGGTNWIVGTMLTRLRGKSDLTKTLICNKHIILLRLQWAHKTSTVQMETFFLTSISCQIEQAREGHQISRKASTNCPKSSSLKMQKNSTMLNHPNIRLHWLASRLTWRGTHASHLSRANCNITSPTALERVAAKDQGSPTLQTSKAWKGSLGPQQWRISQREDREKTRTNSARRRSYPARQHLLSP